MSDLIRCVEQDSQSRAGARSIQHGAMTTANTVLSRKNNKNIKPEIADMTLISSRRVNEIRVFSVTIGCGGLGKCASACACVLVVLSPDREQTCRR